MPIFAPLLVLLAPVFSLKPQGGADASVPQDVASWTGFSAFAGANPVFPTIFPTATVWSQVAPPVVKPSPVVWHLRVMLLDRIDTIETLPDGTLKTQRNSIEVPQATKVKRELDQFASLVSYVTQGDVRVAIDLVEEPNPLHVHTDQLASELDAYARVRFNGGSYDADDHVYRGPYASVLVIHPVAQVGHRSTTVNRTPVTDVSLYGIPHFEIDGVVAKSLSEIWWQQAAGRAAAAGLVHAITTEQPIEPITGLPNPRQLLRSADWAEVVDGTTASDQRLSRLGATGEKYSIPSSLFVGKASFRTVDASLAVATDPVRGQVLVYSEKGMARTGGVVLPTPKWSVKENHTLRFAAKSISRDPLALIVRGQDGKSVTLSIGRDAFGPQSSLQAAFAYDGEWHDVAFDLSNSGLDQVAQVTLGPSSNALQATRNTLGPIEVSFSDFKLSNDTAEVLGDRKPDINSTDVVERAMAARALKPGDTLLKALKDPSDLVKVNALQPLLASSPEVYEVPISELAQYNYDSWVSSTAIGALAKINTDTAKATLARSLRVAVSDSARAAVVRIFAADIAHHPAAEFIPLLEAKEVQTRIEAVKALAKIATPDATIVRMTFLQQADPAIKLAVTESADANDDYQVRKLLWSAVNEPSDAVRLASDIKLIQSKDAHAKAEGYKGVRDDSISVRIDLVEWMAKNPAEAHRSAIGTAVTDRVPLVRAAALLAFGELEKLPTAEELGEVVSDEDPDVQLALIKLSGKGFVIPPTQVAKMKASLDPRVREASKGL